MALCFDLKHVEDINAVYNALNKHGVCVDYDDEKQMKLKKRIIVGKVVHKYPLYQRNPDWKEDKDCLVIMLKKAYPKQCLFQEGRIFRLLAFGNIIAKLANIEVNTFMAIWNPKMIRTFNSSEPSFSIGPQNSVVWLIPELTESGKCDEIVEKDSHCGLNSSSEREHSSIESRCIAGPSDSNPSCSVSAKEKSTAEQNEPTRKIPHCDCNVNKKTRNFCGEAEKCSNENSIFSGTYRNEEDSYSNLVGKNNPDFSYRNRCNCGHAEKNRFKRHEAETCYAPLRNSTNNTGKRTCGCDHQLQKNVKSHRTNKQILHTKSSEDGITTKVAKDKLKDDNAIEWRSWNKVLASNNTIIKKKRKLFFADPRASDAFIDVNSSIGKNNCNSVETKQYKDVQEIQETSNNDRILQLPHKVFEENINKSEKDQKVTFDRRSSKVCFPVKKNDSSDIETNSESDANNMSHRRLLFRKKKRCKRRSRYSRIRNNGTTSTSTSEENLSFADERSELQIESVYTLCTDEEQFLKKCCSLGKDMSYPKSMVLSTKSHLSNFKRNSSYTKEKNNSDDKNTNCRMSKIEVKRIAEINNTNRKPTNNAIRAGDSNNRTDLDNESPSESASTVLIANANKKGNDKTTQTQSTDETSN